MATSTCARLWEGSTVNDEEGGTGRANERSPVGSRTVSTMERQRRRRPASPHTALARKRASLVRTGRRLLRSTEDLLGTCDDLEYEDADDLNVLLAQLDVLTADVNERLTAGEAGNEGATLGQLGA